MGIRHPRGDGLLDTLHVSDVAVCTSGDYERQTDAGHHLLDPRTGAPANAVASVTVLAPSAMVADTLATAAFVLGPTDGIALLERHGVEGLIVTPALERFATRDMPGRSPLLTRSPAMSLVSVRRFFRTPKGLALLAIGLLAIIATVGAGPRRVGPVLTAGNRRRHAHRRADSALARGRVELSERRAAHRA